MALFLQRLLARDLTRLRHVCFGVCGVCALWGLGSVIALGVSCPPDSQCVAKVRERTHPRTSVSGLIAPPFQTTAWAAIAAFDVLTELALMAVPMIIVWPLQMSFYLKLQVSAAFMFRLG